MPYAVISQSAQYCDLVWAKGRWVARVDHERPDHVVTDDERQRTRRAKTILVGRGPPWFEIPRPVRVLQYLQAAASYGRAGRSTTGLIVVPTDVEVYQILRASRRRDWPHGVLLVVFDVADPCQHVSTGDDDVLTGVSEQGGFVSGMHQDLVA